MKCDQCHDDMPRIYAILNNGFWYCLKCWINVPRFRGVINWKNVEKNNKVQLLRKVG